MQKSISKAGIIRRIDELGRIVIPKEIRKTMHIKNGENLEIFIQNDNIILKKYSELDNLTNLSQTISDTLNHNLKSDILITDTDKFINASGTLKTKYLNKEISEDLLNIINNRKQTTLKNKTLILTKNIQEIGTFIITPIITNGDIIGSIIIYNKNNLTEYDEEKANLITEILSKYIEA